MLLACYIKEGRHRILAVDDGALRNALFDWALPGYIYCNTENGVLRPD
ncbi:MAG: hypothetical protein M5T52_25040 [Ignavibacteriaceae bacterium]|nr:hypothetical protein [Ignavibacteriaceae bacterium]